MQPAVRTARRECINCTEATPDTEERPMVKTVASFF